MTETQQTATTASKFEILNYSRARHLAKLLYGPLARVWVGRTDLGAPVVVGTEQNGVKTVKTQGDSFTQALHLPVTSYVVSGANEPERVANLKAVAPYATGLEGIVEAAFPKEEGKEQTAVDAARVDMALRRMSRRSALVR